MNAEPQQQGLDVVGELFRDGLVVTELFADVPVAVPERGKEEGDVLARQPEDKTGDEFFIGSAAACFVLQADLAQEGEQGIWLVVMRLIYAIRQDAGYAADLLQGPGLD